MARHTLLMPDLGLADCPLTASLWLVDIDSEVGEGDRLLEVLAGSVTVDLPAPVGGVLVETLVAEDDPLLVGQPLAVIETRPDGDDAGNA